MTEKLNEPIQPPESSAPPPQKKSIVLRAVLWALFTIAVYVVLTISAIFFYKELFGWFYDFIASSFSSGYLAMAITAVVVAGFLQIPLGKMFRSFLPFLPQKKKTLYRSLTFVLFAVIFFSAHLLRGNDYFDRETGEPLKYYSIHRDGSYHFFSEPGHDPETGDRLEYVTKDIVERAEEYEEKNNRPMNIAMMIFLIGGGIFILFIASFAIPLTIKYKLEEKKRKEATLPFSERKKRAEEERRRYEEEVELNNIAAGRTSQSTSSNSGEVINKTSKKIKFFIARDEDFKSIAAFGVVSPGVSNKTPVNLTPGGYYLAIIDSKKELLNNVVEGLVKRDRYTNARKDDNDYYVYGPNDDFIDPIILDYKEYEIHVTYGLSFAEPGWKLIIEDRKLVFDPWE